jgi:hypothetical protein
MHRGGVPFVSPEVFENVYWATLKPIIQELWADGRQTLFYAEGNWDHHLESFAELPDRSIVFHIDRSDIGKVHRALGDKFCLSGGLSNTLLATGSPDEVRQSCQEILATVAQDGGYIMDASAIVQNDAKIENVRAMTEATLEYGVYSRGKSPAKLTPGGPQPAPEDARPGGFLPSPADGKPQPGECYPWARKLTEIPPVNGDESLCRNVWQSIDGLGNAFIWQCLLSF